MANKQDLIAKVAEATELTKKDSAAAAYGLFFLELSKTPVGELQNPYLANNLILV